MKAQTMNRKATLKTLYRLSKGVDKYFDLFRQLSHGKTVRWLDAWPLFIGEGGVARKGLLRDGLHPNPAGYEVLAEAMKKELSACCSRTRN